MRANGMVLLTVVILVCGSWVRTKGQQTDLTEPTVRIIHTIGCATMEGTNWFVTSATDPTESEEPYTSDVEVADAQNASLGSNRFQLVGVAEFLDVEGLLNQFERSDFTARDSVNASGQLVAGHKVAVKGLFIENADPKRLNLTSVVSLAEACG